MNFIRFLENRFQELRLESDKVLAFDLKVDSEIKAVHEVLEKTRIIAKTLFIPKVLFEYFLVQIGKKPEPKPVITDMIKAQQDAEQNKVDNKEDQLQASSNEPAAQKVTELR